MIQFRVIMALNWMHIAYTYFNVLIMQSIEIGSEHVVINV